MPTGDTLLKCYVRCNYDCKSFDSRICLIYLGIGSLGFQWSGYLVNHVDIAPQFAGVLMGISNCLACLSGIVGPLMVNIITEDVSAVCNFAFQHHALALCFFFSITKTNYA